MIKNQWYAILPSSDVKKGRITATKRIRDALQKEAEKEKSARIQT